VDVSLAWRFIGVDGTWPIHARTMKVLGDREGNLPGATSWCSPKRTCVKGYRVMSGVCRFQQDRRHRGLSHEMKGSAISGGDYSREGRRGERH